MSTSNSQQAWQELVAKERHAYEALELRMSRAGITDASRGLALLSGNIALSEMRPNEIRFIEDELARQDRAKYTPYRKQ